MYFTKSILTLVLASTLFFSCKDSASSASTEVTTEAQNESAVVAKPETASFKIEGMSCAMGCAKTIENKLCKTKGVQKATVDFDKKEAIVDFDASILTTDKIVEVVEAAADGETYKVSDIKTKS